MAWRAELYPPRLDEGAVLALAEALTAIDRRYLAEHPGTPELYRSGVRYRAEPAGQEKWLSTPWVLQAGAGDCEDLACWRAAELQRAGEAARPIVRSRRVGDNAMLYHVLVRRASGAIEDPSARLGMTSAA